MSGITGIFRRDGRDVDPADIKKMNDKIAHRGPDGSKIWCEGPVAFGHQMLHTTQESLHEELPFEDEESGLVITADARIDNRTELAPKLGIEDNEYVSDSYFILKAYEKWGKKCPEELLGDFAFAIWDKNRNKLFCARDHAGVKSFYYNSLNNDFLFASEMKAIVKMHDSSLKLNKLKIAYFLIVDFIDKKFTFYEDIFRLPSACSLDVNFDKFKINKYWELDPALIIKMDSGVDYVNKFKEIFSEAVSCRLRSAHSLGFELSGGLDSSSIVCMAASLNPEKIMNTYGFSFKDIPEVNERDYIGYITEKGGVGHHFLYGDLIGPMDEMESMIWHMEQPTNNPYDSIFWKLFQTMHKKKTRVLLTGIGGDEVVYPGKYCLKDIATSLKFKKLIKELNYYSSLANQSFTRSLFNQVIYFLLPSFIQNWLLKLLGNGNHKFIVNPELARKYGGKEYFMKTIFHSFLEADTSRKNHFVLLNKKAVENSLEVKDKLCSAFCIEPRHPFLDKRLIEFCYGVPDEMKFRFGWGRYLQRIALSGILPPEIQWRFSKTKFNPIIERSLSFENDRLQQIFNDENKLAEYYMDLDILKNMYQNYSSGRGYKSTDVRDLWLVMSLDFWFKKRE